MANIIINKLTFSYDGSPENVFDNVDIILDTDWRLGFTGRNGRGKTTFLKLLNKELDYSGHIFCPCDVVYFPYKVNDTSRCAYEFIEELSVDEEWRLIKELNLLNADAEILYRPFDTLSPGEQNKILIAALFAGEQKFCLIDEPTNHLDTGGRKLLGEYLKSKKGFILVSHDRELLDVCTDHTLSINKTDIEVIKGNFSVYYENKLMADEFERNQNAKLSREISRLEIAQKRKSSWADNAEKAKFHIPSDEQAGVDRGFFGHKAAKQQKTAKIIGDRISQETEEKKKLLKNIESTEALKISAMDFYKNDYIVLDDVCFSYGDKAVLENINLTIKKGDIVSIQGKNGSGKSTLLKLICGKLTPVCGKVIRPQGLVISYVDQNVSHLSGSLSAFAEENDLDRTLFSTILRKMDLSRAELERNIDDYSMGQKKKILIAASLSKPAHLFVWDEPLNYIDVYSRIQIEEVLKNSGITLVFVEHDVRFTKDLDAQIFDLK